MVYKPRQLAVLAGSLLLTQVVAADQTAPVEGLHDNQNNLIALTNATVITQPGKTINNATLVINNGRIVSVKENGKVPATAKSVDMSGKWIYPGFIDPYSGYGIEQPKPTRGNRHEPPQYDGTRTGGNAWNDALHAEKDWFHSFKADAKQAGKYISNGFTTVQTAQLDGILQGQAVTVSLADGIVNDIIYQSQASHFGSFDKGASKQSYPSSLMGSIALLRQTLSDAKWYQSASEKNHDLKGATIEFNAGLAGVNELKQVGLVFNPDDDLGIMRAAKVFQPYKINMTMLGNGFEYRRLNEIKPLKTTLILPVDFPAAPEVASAEQQMDVTLADMRHWEYAPSNPVLVAKSGIEFAFTQSGLEDTNSLWPNIRKSVKRGLSKNKALAALTTTPAKIARVDNKVGKIQSGYIADMVVTNGDIFESGEILSVWTQGKKHVQKNVDYVDVSGRYNLPLNSETYTIVLEQSKAKSLKGHLIHGDDKISLKKLSVNATKINFILDTETLNDAGLMKFSLRHSDTGLVGTYQDDQLTNHRVSLTADKALQTAENTPETQAERDQPSEALVGQLTYPNKAFGLSKLPKQERVLFKNATVWTSESQGILQETDVLVYKGKIDRIGKNLKANKKTRVIDATGMHLTAGIIDEHSHIAISKGVNEGSTAVSAEVRIGDSVNPDDIHIYRSVAGGTTTAQLLHGSANPIGGQAQTIKLRWGEDAEGLKYKKAPPSIKFALGENVKQSNWGDNNTIRYPQTRLGVEALVKDAFLAAKQYQKDKARYDDLSRSQKKTIAAPRYNYRMETLLEILKGKRLVHTHSYVQSEIMMLMKLAESLGFRIHTFTHILEGYKVADTMAEHGAMASTFADWWAYKFEVYDAIPGNTCLMNQQGVTVSVNSDSRDLQRRLNQEAAKSVAYCGMSQEDAWNMVTINPAKQLKIEKHTGSIKAGKEADLVLWTDNPLSIYAKVDRTFIDGREYFSRESDLAMRKSITEERAALINKILADPKAKQGRKGSYQKPAKEWHCEDQEDIWHLLQLEHSQKHNHMTLGAE
jgi:imidazolonepropionase-like amidohydrolase